MDQKDVILHPSQRENLLAKWKPVIDRTFDVWTWTSGHELSWLAEMSSRSSRVCEVGSYHGKSALVMSLANPMAEIFCIDLPQDERCKAILQANVLGRRNIRISFGQSSDFPLHLAESGPFQMVFLDGGHKEEDLRKDIENLLPHMAVGAIMAGHDWRHGDMDDGVNRAVLKAFGKERVNTYESIWFVKL